ncbi:uncharacterized protein SPSK_07966 [Sporothrix schenckii 1099-18]|uniref:Uncharacterized protein n=2 Tax=Sporothrix schenckii TaxID=29908 RepID=U7Q1E9_SPOS1|nr:uncharacterized protein SPSK_07966 [Sporothrix schenckii 1099-18]ERT01688.1 hypothetical protein HMPREF1624_02941 [Sporothrix schenckii ATCC 58251]KJR88921.1 hypothetical protein SPSK_07966 [Sporothrix schenckii 1099-18]
MMSTSNYATTAVAVALLSLLGSVCASPMPDVEYSPQQLREIWAAAAAATPPAHNAAGSPHSGVTVTLTGTPVDARPTAVAATTTPAIAAAVPGRPFRPPFRGPPWLTAGIGAGGTVPAGWGTGVLTAGAVCGPYTLPVNLPFSPPCPYSSTTAPDDEPSAPPTSTAPAPGPPSTTIVKTLPPTTLPAAAGSPTAVIVTVSVTLKPDPPYTPGPHDERVATTLTTARRV